MGSAMARLETQGLLYMEVGVLQREGAEQSQSGQGACADTGPGIASGGALVKSRSSTMIWRSWWPMPHDRTSAKVARRPRCPEPDQRARSGRVAAYIQWNAIICRTMRWECIRIVPMPSLLVRFGKTVRKLRAEAGYSQESFAAAVGVHRTYMGTIERGHGNPTLDMIAKIARGLGMSVTRLLEKVEGG
jgi:DNA-binding XRE family transcriptional regulator